jgi:thioredoxin reductase (NADPH)
MEASERPPLTETPDTYGAFPRLNANQTGVLAEHGERRGTQPGEVLCRQGDPSCDFFVILEGKVAVVDELDDPGHPIRVHGPGRFLGELSLLMGQAVLLTAIVREPGEVLAVPVDRLRALVAHDTALGDLILRAFLIRRSILVGLGTGLRIVGSRYSSDTRRLRDFACRNWLPHRWIDLEDDPAAEALLQNLGVRPAETPVVILRGERILRNPSNAELARVMGLRPPDPDMIACDLIVVGAGPAGLAAAVYGASEGLATVVVDGVAPGGQAGTSPRIENYLGFPGGLSGTELMERATIQARKFGAHLTVPAEATALGRRDGHHVVSIDDGTEITGRTVLIATGVRYRRLPIARLEEFEGTSVYHAATQVEAKLCAGDPVAVVGGGNSAGQASLFLARHTARVNLLVRHDDLARDMSRYLVDQIEQTPRVNVVRGVELRELVGEGSLQSVVVESNRTGERQTIEARALFVFIGAEPQARWLHDEVALDDRGFVLTGPDAAGSAEERPGRDPSRTPHQLETSRPGVFAAGDVRSGSIKRIAAAVGEGSMAVRLVHQYLEEIGAPTTG